MVVALELNNRYTKALMRRARAYEQQGRKEECLQGMHGLSVLTKRVCLHCDSLLF